MFLSPSEPPSFSYGVGQNPAHHSCHECHHLDRRGGFRDHGDFPLDVSDRRIPREGAPVPECRTSVRQHGEMAYSGRWNNGFLVIVCEIWLWDFGTEAWLGVLIMIIAWALYTVILHSERKVFGKIFADPEKIDMNNALRIINRMHWALLVISFSAVAGGVWFGHS